jgi:NO-binding membrane sensor protein with MHYT domain
MLKVIGCITEEHDIRLVVVAGLICLFASFTAFNLMDRATITQRTRYVWLATAALVTGSGVWATHFVAMLAFKPGIPVGYDIDLTALSILIAVVISGVGFLVSLDWRQHALGGMIVALAVGTMHFVGMAALDVAAQKNWDYSYVAASVAVGLTFAAAALVVFQRGRDLSFRLASSGLLTLGICGMHFTAMTALSFTPDPLIEIPTHAIQSEWLGIGVIGVALLIVRNRSCGFGRRPASRATRRDRGGTAAPAFGRTCHHHQGLA